MKSSTSQKEYSTIEEAFNKCRAKADHIGVAKHLTGIKLSPEKAKAIILYFVTDFFKDGEDAVIALGSYKLLKGYNHINKLENRRMKTAILTGRSSGDVVRKREEELFARISDHYIDGVLTSGQKSKLLENAIHSEYYNMRTKRAVLPEPFKLLVQSTMIFDDMPSATEEMLIFDVFRAFHGVERFYYTQKEIAEGCIDDDIVINSAIDGIIGDERTFIGIELTDNPKRIQYGGVLKTKVGDILSVCLFVQNDNPNGMNAIAENVRAAVTFTPGNRPLHHINGFILSSNAKRRLCWSDITITADTPFNIFYINGSAHFINKALGEISLSDDIVNNLHGALLGYNQIDGRIPGGSDYSGLVTLDIRIQAE